MKKLPFAILSILLSCTYYEQELEYGCHTALNPDGQRVILHCCARSTYVNEPNYRLQWFDYTDHKWTKSEGCNCQ